MLIETLMTGTCPNLNSNIEIHKYMSENFKEIANDLI